MKRKNKFQKVSNKNKNGQYFKTKGIATLAGKVQINVWQVSLRKSKSFKNEPKGQKWGV